MHQLALKSWWRSLKTSWGNPILLSHRDSKRKIKLCATNVCLKVSVSFACEILIPFIFQSTKTVLGTQMTVEIQRGCSRVYFLFHKTSKLRMPRGLPGGDVEVLSSSSMTMMSCDYINKNKTKTLLNCFKIFL